MDEGEGGGNGQREAFWGKEGEGGVSAPRLRENEYESSTAYPGKSRIGGPERHDALLALGDAENDGNPEEVLPRTNVFVSG